jgi:membrane protein implicated in regulation of membrane protease activity
VEAFIVIIVSAFVLGRIILDPFFVDLLMSVGKKLGLAPGYRPIGTPGDDPVVGLAADVVELFKFDEERANFAGKVIVHGSLWNAEWEATIGDPPAPGQKVTVIGREGLWLEVTRKEGTPHVKPPALGEAPNSSPRQ